MPAPDPDVALQGAMATCARLQAALDGANRVAATLHRIGHLLHAELDVDKVVQRLTDEATSISRAQFGAFFYNVVSDAGESYMLYTLAGVPREKFAGFPMPRNTAIFAPTFRGEGVVRLDDVTQDPRFGANAPYHGMPQGHLPVRSYLAVSVIARAGDVIGGLFFGHASPGVFTAEDEDLLVAIAAQAANAIENARLYEAERKARERAEASERLTARLHAITAALSRALSAEDAARIVIRETRALFGAPAGGVMLIGEHGTHVESLVIDGEYSRPGAAQVQGLTLDANVPLCEAARTCKVVWVAGADEIARRYPELVGMRDLVGVKTWGAMPIVFEGRTLGSIGFRCNEERPLLSGEAEFLLAVGRQCGQAIERARLYDSTQTARADAEQANRAKDEFLALLGHELRNPLAPILAAVQLMKLRGDTATAKEQSVIERQVNHLIRLVDDLLDTSRITRGKVHLELRPVEVAVIVTKAMEIVSPLLDERRHHVIVELPDQAVWLQADEIRLCQAITNLLTNAAKYTEPGGRIEVRVCREAGELAIRVKDNGIGIPESLLPRVFDPFVQGYQASDRGRGGLGIGLALARNLVVLHRGTIAVASDGVGRGTELSIRLPILDRAAPPPDDELPPMRPGVVPRRILLVDDNEDAAEMLASVLASAGHEVVVAHDGPQALDAVVGFSPEVAILDIGLPVMDGYELADALRLVVGSTLRLMAVTGYGQAKDLARSKHAGFEVHFAKPVGLDTLLTAIEAR